MSTHIKRLTINADGNTDVPFDPGLGPIKAVLNISGTITIKFQYGDALLGDSPNYQDSTVVTGVTASATYKIESVPTVRIVASGTSGGTATVLFAQEGQNYDLDDHFSNGDV